ncbi:uncharacterized protein LOC105440180 [Strongylocentrotus purpuratus]|uniref:WD repeat and coiled-coil-containing protein n=1 Tax=Strongylocentrotus purpuratus TaxID=7668 RepID=A0A7M7PFB0_STRPU|nr:uncharacterized protein LOC105440180 [Strongylocentrotus purpuratus]
MDVEFKIAYGVAGRNILHYAVHSDLGFVWTDGECVYLSAITDSGHTIPSMHNTKTLGKFSEVTGCSWSQCQTLGTHYLAVQHKTCVVIWTVETRNSASNREFKKFYTVEHREQGRGCVWHPRKPLLVVFTKSQVVLYSIQNGETNVLDNGLDIIAACWTQDGHHLALADGNQLQIFTMDKENETTTDMQSTLIEGNLGSVCSMIPISKHTIAIATELPLQKIVTELSADLFSPETSVNECNKEDVQNGSHSVVRESRACVPVTHDHPDGHALVYDLNLEANCDLVKLPIKRNVEICSSFIKQSTEGDIGSLESVINGHQNNSSANADKSNASRIVEDALKERKGPIDVMDILSRTKERKRSDLTETKVSNDEKHSGSINPTVNSTNEGETKDCPKPMYAPCSGMNGREARTCMYQAESIDEKPHYHLTKDLKLESNNGCHEGIPIRGKASIVGSKLQTRHDGREKSSSESENKMVDLTFLRSHGARGVPQFKQTREPGAGSCARLTLFDVGSKKFVSHSDLHGIITPSIIHYQPNSRVIAIGSHSRRTLSLFSLKESLLKRLPQTIELGETERPVGVCSIPDTKGSILVAVTKPVSDDGSFRGVLPSSALEARHLFLKIVDLPLGQSISTKEVTDSRSFHRDGATSAPGDDDDDGLQTLLLPGGVAFNANGESMGRRLGIEVLEEDEEHDAASVDPLIGHTLDVQPQSSQSGLYPTPENAAYVNLRLLNDGQVFQKCFLLQSGLLPLQTILDVFHLSQVEMQVGPRWIVLTSDDEGVVPLRFSAGSSYDIREATV